MRHVWFVVLLLASHPLIAGGYYDVRIDIYDPITGLYYKAVEKKAEDRGFLGSTTTGNDVVNLSIFNPSTGVSTLLFKEPQKDNISTILFETGFKDGSVEFNGSTHSNYVLNNTHLQKREPKDRLLVGIRNSDTKETTLFVFDKKGNGIKKLATVPIAADWHIDVKNSKLRVIHQTGQAVRVESYQW